MSETRQIFSAMAKVMAEVGAVAKAKKNLQQNYQFRGIDDVVAAIQDVMAAHGVVCVPSVREREREMLQTKAGTPMASVRLLVDHHFFAADGSFVTCTTLGEAMDSGDKASNKAMSAALKYALTETFLIPTYEKDRDTEEHTPVMAQQDTLKAQLAASVAATTKTNGHPSWCSLPKPHNGPRDAQTPPASVAAQKPATTPSPAAQQALAQAHADAAARVERRTDTPPAPKRKEWMTAAFGRAKGKTPPEMTEKDLDFYSEAARKTLADPSKEKFWAKEKKWLAQLEEARNTTPPPADEPPPHTDADAPF